MMADYPELNEIEQRAVNWNTGPLLVLADGNVSRRSVVSYRMERFFKESPNSPPFILALTHSSKSVDEMQSKIRPHYDGTNINRVANTSHGLISQFFISKGWHIGLDKFYKTIVEESDRLLYLGEIIKMTVPDRDGLRSERLLPLVTRLFEGDVEPDRAAQMLEEQSFSDPETLARIYRNFRDQMLARSILDPSGMVAAVLLLYEKRPGIHKTYKGIFKNLCIEDFQNLTAIEYRFFNELAHAETRSLFVMADDALMFNRWDMEGIDRLRDMQLRFKMDICQLPASQNCPPEIAAVGNRLATQNFKASTVGTFDNSLNGNGNAVGMHQFDDFAEEIQWIASDIAKRDESFRQNCAVVANSKGILSRVAKALQQQGIAGYLPFGQYVFESVQINWLIAMLRFADSRHSDEYLRQACRSFYRLSGIALNIRDITTYASVENCDNLRSWTVAVLAHADATPDLRQLVADSMVPHLVDRMDFQRFQDSAFEWMNGMADSDSNFGGFAADFADEWSDWQGLVAETAKQHGGSLLSLHVLVNELDRLTKAPPQPENAVPCLPMHVLNGREFDHVYLVGMMDGSAPSQNSIRLGDSSYAMQEERRICASVITSAKKSLTFTCSDSMDGILTYPSRFLYETGLLEFADASGYAAGERRRVAVN